MNYKIIGADRKEYGPVPFGNLKIWIEQGRANANTLVQAEGTTDWKPLSAFPEFAPFFGPKPPVVPFGSESKTDPVALANEILARDYNLDIGSCLSRAWALVKSDFWPIIGITALVILIRCAAEAAYVGIIVSGPLMGGLFQYYLKKMRGESAEIGDAFSGFSFFLQLFLGYLVSTVLTGAGLVLCILPGIYLAIAWQFTLPLVADKKIEFWPAMDLSRKVISKHWWSFFGFAIVMILIHLLGVLALGVGIFVSIPVTLIALMYAYEDIFRAAGGPPAQSQ